MEPNEIIQETLKHWANMVEREIKDLLERSNVRSTGKLIESVAFDGTNWVAI